MHLRIAPKLLSISRCNQGKYVNNRFMHVKARPTGVKQGEKLPVPGMFKSDSLSG